jgi:hypothetical protein
MVPLGRSHTHYDDGSKPLSIAAESQAGAAKPSAWRLLDKRNGLVRVRRAHSSIKGPQFKPRLPSRAVPEARSWPPPDLYRPNRQREFRPAPEQGLKRALSLDARELKSEAEMNARAESDMAVRVPLEIEPLRSLVKKGSPLFGRRDPATQVMADAISQEGDDGTRT